MPERHSLWRKVGLVAGSSHGAFAAVRQVEENFISSKIRVGGIQILTFVDIQCGEVLFQVSLQKFSSHSRWALIKVDQDLRNQGMES